MSDHTNEFWHKLWRERRTPWDQSGAHPLLHELIEEAQEYGFLAQGARILEPGCGRAHNGAALARLGYVVTSFDLSEDAIAEARQLYGGQPGLELITGDTLTLRDDWVAAFDVVFDRAMLCAIPERMRPAYLDACFSALKPGGVFLSIPFTQVRVAPEDGPPFALGMTELSALLAPGFSLVHAEERPVVQEPNVATREMLSIWRRRRQRLIES